MAGVDRPTKETAHRVEEIPGLGRRIGPAVATGDDVRASFRNRGRLQIGIPAGFMSEHPAGLNRNPHANASHAMPATNSRVYGSHVPIRRELKNPASQLVERCRADNLRVVYGPKGLLETVTLPFISHSSIILSTLLSEPSTIQVRPFGPSVI